MTKTKPRKVERTPHTQLFNEVLEGMAYAKLSPNEWQFIMVLWRLTYGRKNMTHAESGKLTQWSNAEWHRRTGISRQNLNRIKNNLLAKKVLIKKKDQIGFNKHFKKWSKCSLYRLCSLDRLYSQDRLKSESVQTTTIVSTDYKDAPKVLTSEEVQLLKKERKKETTNKDFIYTKEFLSFWDQYPKKRQKFAAKQSWESHYTKHGRFELGNILTLLQRYIKVDWAGREEKYIPYAASWLNKRPWDDGIPSKLSRKETIRKQWLLWQGGGITEEEFEKRKKHIINTYKETM